MSKLMGFWYLSHSFINVQLVGLDVLEPRNYQVSKEVVHELEFGDIAVIQI